MFMECLLCAGQGCASGMEGRGDERSWSLPSACSRSKTGTKATAVLGDKCVCNKDTCLLMGTREGVLTEGWVEEGLCGLSLR